MKNRKQMKKGWNYVGPILLCFLAGGLASLFQNSAIDYWYPFLDKPSLTPPNWAFPVAWSIIYLCMGISAGIILSSHAAERPSVMRLWYAQLCSNFLWSILFFTLRNPLLGLLDILLLDLLVIAYILRSARIRKAAAWLFAPYLCWILLATYLNAWILIANGTGF